MNRKNGSVVFVIFLSVNMSKTEQISENPLLIEISDVDVARKAFIASEIFNRKY